MHSWESYDYEEKIWNSKLTIKSKFEKILVKIQIDEIL